MPTPVYLVTEEFRRQAAHIIRTQRKAQGFKQSGLADLAQVSTAYLSRVERADPHYTYHDEMFVRVARALELNPDLIRPRTAPPLAATPPAPTPLWTEPAGPVQPITPETQEIVIPGGARIILTIQVVPAEEKSA